MTNRTIENMAKTWMHKHLRFADVVKEKRRNHLLTKPESSELAALSVEDLEILEGDLLLEDIVYREDLQLAVCC